MSTSCYIFVFRYRRPIIGALNLATGAAAHVISVGSSSAGAITVDTAAGISLDAATASNFTVTGAADLSLISTAGSIVINAEEAADDAIQLTSAAGGLSASLALSAVIATSEANADSMQLTSGGGIDITATGAATKDIDIVCTSGSVNISGGEDVADAVVISAGAGGIDILATGAAAQDIDIVNTGGSLNLSATEAQANSITVTSTAGGIDILATGAGAGLDIDIVNTGGSVNITASESAADAMVITASGAAGGIQLVAGTNGILQNSGQLVKVTGVAAAATPYTVLGTDFFIATDVTGGVLSLTLPASPATGRYLIVSDSVGQAGANTITLNGNGKNISLGATAAGSKTITTAYQAVGLIYNGTIWNAFVLA